ncbi:MAG: MarR family winged helix-turn-helix transcriptional regulator [Promethearchaeota archaeon]
MSKKSKSLIDLTTNITDLIRKLGKQFDQNDRDLIRFHGIQGITPPQLFILRMLWMEDGMPLNYLASIAKVSRATMTGIVDTMEKNGFVVRTSNPDDERSKLVYLTQRGNEVKQYKPPIDLNIYDFFRDFKPEEVDNLNRLLEKLSESVEK